MKKKMVIFVVLLVYVNMLEFLFSMIITSDENLYLIHVLPLFRVFPLLKVTFFPYFKVICFYVFIKVSVIIALVNYYFTLSCSLF